MDSQSNKPGTGRLVFEVVIPAKCPSLNALLSGGLTAKLRQKKSLKQIAAAAIASALKSWRAADATETLTTWSRNISSTSCEEQESSQTTPQRISSE